MAAGSSEDQGTAAGGARLPPQVQRAFVAGLVGLPVLVGIRLATWEGAPGSGLLPVGLGVTLALLVAVPLYAGWEHRALRRAGAALEVPQETRLFGFVRRVRGLFQRLPVLVAPGRVEVELRCPQPQRWDPVTLAALARGRGTLAARPGCREAAQRLREQGVASLELTASRLVLTGGAGPLAERLADALLLARAASLVQGGTEQRDCPFCHQALGADPLEGQLRCAGCDTVHHTECWREHGGCAVHRCARSPRERRGAR